MNKYDKGLICFIVGLSLIISVYIGLYIGGYYSRSINPIEYSFKFLLEKYMFYAAFISMQIGYFYIYGDIEKDFNKIIIVSISTFIVMDLQAVFNLLGYINSLF